MTDDAPPFPLAGYLGMRIERADGRADAVIDELGEAHGQPHGAVHGAVLFALIDTAMGAAAVSVLEEGRICATSDLQLRFLRPVFQGGSLRATATVVNAGRRQIVLDGELHDGDDRLVATATSAFAVL